MAIQRTVLNAPYLRLLGVASAFMLPAVTLAADLEEVIITAEGIGTLRLNTANEAGGRLGLTPLETPASVDMLTAEEIATKGDYDAVQAVTRAAGLTSSANPGNGGTSMSARGFNGHGSITQTYDGNRLYVAAGTVTFPADTWTLERIEVLRGAGSVVNGFGAIGATINYVPKTPQPGAPAFDALVALGSYSLQRIALGGGADLSDNWSYRLDGAHQTSDGQAQRNEKQREVFAGSLLFRPSDAFSMRFSGDYADLHEDSPYFGTPLVNGQASDELREQNFNFADGFTDYKDASMRVRTDWKVAPNMTFRNDTYMLDTKRQWQNLEVYGYDSGTDLINRDGYSYYGIIHDQEQVGTRSDLLISSRLGGRDNKFTVGFDINSIDLTYSNNFFADPLYGDVIDSDYASVPVLGWTPDTLAIANTPTVPDFTTDTTQYGLFFDDALQLNPQWSVVFGARYDNIDFSRTDLPLAGSPQSSFDSTYSEWSWRGGIVFEPVEAMSLYAQYSQATDPVTSPVTMNGGSRNFDPTRGKQFEVGLKQQLMGGMAEYTVALFDIVKTGLVTTRPGSPFAEQIGEQSSRGAEVTLRLNPTQALALDFNAAWVDAEFDEYFSGASSYAGNVPNGVPEFTANGWVNWTPANGLSLGAGARYVGSRFANDANTRDLPAYTVLDARAAWSFNERLQLTLRARNLTDERNYVLSEYDVNQWLFGEPRSYEIGLSYSL